MTDADYPVDMGAIFKAIDSAEVIIFRSVTMPHRFLFDRRLGCHNVWERTC